MKRILTLILTLALGLTAIFGLTGCKDETKTLTLGFDAEFPPYGYYDSETKSYTGFDIELAKKVCDNLGYELKVYPINWAIKDQMLETGLIDFIWNGFTYEGREDDYTWSDKYLSSSIVILSKDTVLADTDALAGKKVAVQNESSAQTAIEDIDGLTDTFTEYTKVADYNTALTSLTSGAIDAIIIDYGVAKGYMKDNATLKMSSPISTESYAIGFLKGNTTLCKEINDELNKISKENPDFIKSLCEKYEISYDLYLLK